MYYEINIAKNGYHFIATAERSIQSFQELQIAYPILKKKFPKEEGYELTIKKMVRYTEYIDESEL